MTAATQAAALSPEETARLGAARILASDKAAAYRVATLAHAEADGAWSRAMTAEYGKAEGAYTRHGQSARWDGRGTATPALRQLASLKAEACEDQSRTFNEMLGAQSLVRSLLRQFGLEWEA